MSSYYIKEIRKKIGHEYLLLPSVTVLIFDSERRVLLARHHNEDVWVAPGGMVEPDEEPEAAAVREIREEIGCHVQLVKIIGSYGGPDFRIRYANGDEVGYVMTVYEAAIVDGEISPDGHEILEVRYFSYEETKFLRVGKWLPHVLKKIYD